MDPEVELLANLLLLRQGQHCAWPAPANPEQAAMVARLARATRDWLTHSVPRPPKPDAEMEAILEDMATIPNLRVVTPRTSP